MAGEKHSSKPGPKPKRANTDADFDTVIKRALKKKPLKTVESGETEPDQDQNNPSGGDKPAE